MLLKAETYQQQSKLAQYCRDGVEVEILGAQADRLPNYRRLVFNVVKDALETTYPISFRFIDSVIWNKMVYNFFSIHKCVDPQVWRMPEEFYQFCLNKNYAEKYDLPFLNDLLYFEWLEVEIYMMEDRTYPEFKNSSNWLDKKIALNPEHKIIKLEYPVHLKNPLDADLKKGAYFLLLYREKESGRVQFINLSILYTFLLENIVLGEKTLEQIFTDILHLFGINDLTMLQTESLKFLKELYAKGFVLGVLT